VGGEITGVEHCGNSKRKRELSSSTGKTPVKPSKHGTLVIQPSSTYQSWSMEEKVSLHNFVSKHGIDKPLSLQFWNACAALMNTTYPDKDRTGTSCRNAYRRLLITSQSEDLTQDTGSVTETCHQRYAQRQSTSTQTDAVPVLVTVHYPSGRKAAIIWPEPHKRMVKAICHGNSCEKNIQSIITEEKPMLVVRHAADIIRTECRNICKRGASSLLQNTDYDSLLSFSWDNVCRELESNCPCLLVVLESIISDSPISRSGSSKPFIQLMMTAIMGLRGRKQEMSAAHYMIGFVLMNGGCNKQTIERISTLGLCVRPETVQRKLQSWRGKLDEDVLSMKQNLENGGDQKYQLVGDNWDKDILPSYRTMDRKTESLHLFNRPFHVINYIPSVDEQKDLLKELVFLVATSVIQNIPQLSDVLGQFPLGLFDCNENKIQDVIRHLQEMSKKYVPLQNGKIVEPVFFGGDRLTDERVQGAQMAMKNAETLLTRLEGFISKIEDFHRLMDFLEAIAKLSYRPEQASERRSMAFYRNFLNYRNDKADVKNSYRANKMMYHAMLDAIILVMFFEHFGINCIPENSSDLPEIPIPEDLLNEGKISWINNVCEEEVKKWFFKGSSDVYTSLREIFDDSEHADNYWVSNCDDTGRFKCHYCERSYSFIASVQNHETKEHQCIEPNRKKKEPNSSADDLQDYTLMLFKLTILHKNLDSAVDMGDGEKCVRSAKYELPVYNKTNKTKYLINSVHLIALTKEVLPHDQRERLVANRFINIQGGGGNRNISLDEYVEMLNRDSKSSCT
ncbi:hypothetical protein MAR_007580, partial [Mya arenaria]